MAIRKKNLINRTCYQIEKDAVTVIGKIQRIQLVDDETGEVLKNAEYQMMCEEEKYTKTGKTDDNGYLSHFPKGNYNIWVLPRFQK